MIDLSRRRVLHLGSLATAWLWGGIRHYEWIVPQAGSYTLSVERPMARALCSHPLNRMRHPKARPGYMKLR